MAVAKAIEPLLTDQYRILTSYSYWQTKQANEAVFELYIMNHAFSGQFTIFAGLQEFLEGFQNFKFEKSDIDYLKEVFQSSNLDPTFYDYLMTLDLKDIKISSVPEGTIVFPREPIMILEGKLPLLHLLEPYLLASINTACMITTNAVRFRLAAGPKKCLGEWGNMRALTADAAVLASKYCYMAGFDSTSNILAAKKYGIPIHGTFRTFITAYENPENLPLKELKVKNGEERKDLSVLSLKYLNELQKNQIVKFEMKFCRISELATFITYAVTCPDDFYVSVHVYDATHSGIPNFCAVSLALSELGYKAKGVRIDSYSCVNKSVEIRNIFRSVGEHYNIPWFAEDLSIIVTSNLDEEALLDMKHRKNEINYFGIGHHAVMTDKKPLLKCFYDLVELDNEPKAEYSSDRKKFVYPGKKKFYRLFDRRNFYLADYIMLDDEPEPLIGQHIYCTDLVDSIFRDQSTDVIFHTIEPEYFENIMKVYWYKGKIAEQLQSLTEVRKYIQKQFESLRADHIPPYNQLYKVYLSKKLFHKIDDSENAALHTSLQETNQ